jgi:UDP-N-acetylglucosamine 2-epimerase
MLDATNYYSDKAENKSTIVTDLKLTAKEFVLATIHRAENTNNLEKLSAIFASLEKLAHQENLILPIHPRTRNSLKDIDFSLENSNINFISPVGYLDMMMLEKYARVIITDSGGVQKEAYFHKVPCITLRDETEWTELVENGFNFLTNSKNLIFEFNKAIKIDFSANINLYGNGDASLKIVDEILRYQSKMGDI